MFKRFMPDMIFEKFSDITPGFLKEKGIRVLLLDIDNTLVTYDDEKPTDEVLAWFTLLRENGIDFAFVSNNSVSTRAEVFSDGLGAFSVSRAGKPFTSGYRRALEHMKALPNEAASVGDQIFTDVWAAKNIGAYAIMVPPIKDKLTPFFRFKRWLEKPIIKRYYKKKEKNK